MWELDYKESWALKNWCFWTVVLEKTLKSPLDCREIGPGYSLEGLMLKLKLQYSGRLMQRADSLEKILMLGKIEDRRRGRQRMWWLDGITDTMDIRLGGVWELVMDREVSCAAVHGFTKSWTRLSNWTETVWTDSVRSNVMLFLGFCYKRQCGFQSPYFFLDSLSKRKASCPVVSKSLVTITEVSSQCIIWVVQFSSVQSLSRVLLFGTPWTAAHQAALSVTNSRSLLKLISTESVTPSNDHILCCPLLFLSSTFPSIRVFSKVTSSHQVAKVLEFQLQHQSFQWIFRTDFL